MSCLWLNCGLNWGGFVAVKGLFSGQVWVGKIACTRTLKEPRERNCMGSTQLLSCTIHARPSTSDGHNFLVQTPF